MNHRRAASAATLRRLAIIGAMLSTSITVRAAGADDLFKVSGHAELDYESSQNFDLNNDSDEHYTTLEAETRLRFEYLPSDNFNVVGQLRPRRKFALHEGDDRENSHEKNHIDFEELYLAIKPQDSDFELWLGRSRIRDSREWIHDVWGDAVRGFYKHDNLKIEAALFRETLLSADLLRTDKEDPQNNFYVNADYDYSDDVTFSGWWMTEDELDGNNPRRHFMGLRSNGEVIKNLKYCLELAHLRSDGNGTKVRGYGLDISTHYRFDAPLKPRLILGYALGTGDDGNGGTDHTFHQTGFEDNNGRTGGVNRYKFYGETLEPELSNMTILTLGAGITPAEDSSIELVWHDYRQQHASDSLRSNLDIDPLGIDTDLGHEFDIVYAYDSEATHWRINVVAGWFMPGDAFGPEADNALFTGMETRYNF